MIVVALALLVAVQVVRNAAVAALAPLRPAAAERLWSSHPEVEISLALAAIGEAARLRRPIDPRAFELINEAAVKSPLSPEPFLVSGVRTQVNGDMEAAKSDFLAAQLRDPRSLPAAYFLATYYFRAGEALHGLEQTASLARLSPGGTAAVTPFVAAYAQDRSNWPKMRALFGSQQGLEDGVLTALAQDARNADAVLALADPEHRSPDSNWLPVLLSSLVAGADYGRAHTIWSSVGGGNGSSELVFDSDFSRPEPPPPFNWSLVSSTIGLAERQPGRRLHVLFYGNEDGALASELVLLPPGAYRLKMELVGGPVHPESLRWLIRCDKSTEPIGIVGIEQAARSGWTFQIPANCPAQWLELSGRSGDVAQQAEATITGLNLQRSRTNG